MGSLYSAVAVGFTFLGIWLIYLKMIEFYLTNYALHPIFVFPLPLVTFLGLYWVRWWIFQTDEVVNLNSIRCIEWMGVINRYYYLITQSNQELFKVLKTPKLIF